MRELEKIFDIKINDEGLFKKALTHSSYTNENKISCLDNYERLEFLGDAVLKLAISEILYKKYPEYSEGQLTKIRAVVVSDSMLGQISNEVGLDKLVILGEHDNKLRKLESIRACVFEAVLGAYYLDAKAAELWKFLEEIFTPYIEDIDKSSEKYNAKAVLQEFTQGKTKEVPEYRLVKEAGPAHNKTFTVEVVYRGEVLGSGQGKTKKEAEQKGALEACKILGVVENG
jgi:ribonuclease-3